MKKTIALSLMLIISLVSFSGCSCKHEEWNEATCSSPKTCKECGASEGEKSEHKWVDADCNNPVTCSECGETAGSPLEHIWSDADCENPVICTLCGETAGSALGHEWVEPDCENPQTCSKCGKTLGKALSHKWEKGSCTEPKTCTRCKKTQGKAEGHKWSAATLSQPKKCTVCGKTEGTAINAEYCGTGYVDTAKDALNMRKSPDVSAEIVGSIPKDTNISLYYCDKYDWYLTEYKGVTGYVRAEYIAYGLHTEFSDMYYLGTGTVKTKGSELYIRNAKDYSDDSKVGVIPNGKTVDVYYCDDSSWYYVYYNGVSGYSSSDYIVLDQQF